MSDENAQPSTLNVQLRNAELMVRCWACCRNHFSVMSSVAETSLTTRDSKMRDGKPGLADYFGCVAASTSLGMTKLGDWQVNPCRRFGQHDLNVQLRNAELMVRCWALNVQHLLGYHTVSIIPRVMRAAEVKKEIQLERSLVSSRLTSKMRGLKDLRRCYSLPRASGRAGFGEAH
jgi:hypothetical protein